MKVWVTESPLQSWPSQQVPCRSMAVQGLEVPWVTQDGRWQVLMYTGTEKLPGGGQREGSEPRGGCPLEVKATFLRLTFLVSLVGQAVPVLG